MLFCTKTLHIHHTNHIGILDIVRIDVATAIHTMPML
jgi:hypothetical protein